MKTKEEMLSRWADIYKAESIKYGEDYLDGGDVGILMSRTLKRFVEEYDQENAELRRELESVKKPFLGWTTDRDILNQQREYWGAINGIDKLRAELSELKAREKERMEQAFLHGFMCPD